MENSIQINGVRHRSLASCEAIGLAKCLEAYADFCPSSSIFEMGFNENSGYTYIVLEMECISICSMLGGDVEYLVTDFENGEEHFFDSYLKAVEFDSTI